MHELTIHHHTIFFDFSKLLTMSSTILLCALALLCVGALSKDISHSKRDWVERKTWNVVWRQGEGNDDRNKPESSNTWNQQEKPWRRPGGWNRDTQISGPTDWNNNNNFGGWNNNNLGGWNNNNLGGGWNTNSFVNRWSSNTLNRGWNMKNPTNDWNNNINDNRWDTGSREKSWSKNRESNDQDLRVRPTNTGKVFRRIETVRIEQ